MKHKPSDLVTPQSGRGAFAESALPAASARRPPPRTGALRPLPKSGGFTLIELCAVIAVIALLGATAVCGFGRTRPVGQFIRCQNNLKQITAAWSMYAADNASNLASNNFSGGSLGGVLSGWVTGWLDWGTSPDNTNTLFLTDPRYAELGPYVGRKPAVFKCPADRYQVPNSRGPRVRSVSMNAALGPGAGNKQTLYSPPFFLATKMTELVKPGPAGIFVIADEHPDSINDGCIINNPLATPGGYAWTDLPASYHEGGCGFSFADGHTELKKWTDPRTILPVTMGVFSGQLAVPNSSDYAWLAARMTQR